MTSILDLYFDDVNLTKVDNSMAFYFHLLGVRREDHKIHKYHDTRFGNFSNNIEAI